MHFRDLVPWHRQRQDVTRTPDSPFQALHARVDRLFDEFLQGFDAPSSFGRSFLPSLDLSETPEEYLVKMDLPGIEPGDIDVSLDDDILTVRGEKRSEERREDENVHHLERHHGRFERSIRLPGTTTPDKVDARFDKGVLTVRLPRVAPANDRTRRIEVQAD